VKPCEFSTDSCTLLSHCAPFVLIITCAAAVAAAAGASLMCSPAKLREFSVGSCTLLVQLVRLYCCSLLVHLLFVLLLLLLLQVHP
jgi:hypothetical protein